MDMNKTELFERVFSDFSTRALGYYESPELREAIVTEMKPFIAIADSPRFQKLIQTIIITIAKSRSLSPEQILQDILIQCLLLGDNMRSIELEEERKQGATDELERWFNNFNTDAPTATT